MFEGGTKVGFQGVVGPNICIDAVCDYEVRFPIITLVWIASHEDENELTLHKDISKVDPDGHFTSKLLHWQKFSSPCQSFTELRTNTTHMAQSRALARYRKMLGKVGGQHVLFFAYYVYTGQSIRVLRQKNLDLHRFVPGVCIMLYNFASLVQAGVHHLDIKSDNVTYFNDAKGQFYDFYFIDFGWGAEAKSPDNVLCTFKMTCSQNSTVQTNHPMYSNFFDFAFEYLLAHCVFVNAGKDDCMLNTLTAEMCWEQYESFCVQYKIPVVSRLDDVFPSLTPLRARMLKEYILYCQDLLANVDIHNTWRYVLGVTFCSFRHFMCTKPSACNMINHIKLCGQTPAQHYYKMARHSPYHFIFNHFCQLYATATGASGSLKCQYAMFDIFGLGVVILAILKTFTDSDQKFKLIECCRLMCGLIDKEPQEFLYNIADRMAQIVSIPNLNAILADIKTARLRVKSVSDNHAGTRSSSIGKRNLHGVPMDARSAKHPKQQNHVQALPSGNGCSSPLLAGKN